MQYSSDSVTTYNPSLNCDLCAGLGGIPVYTMSWRLTFNEVCPKCKGTGEAQTKNS